MHHLHSKSEAWATPFEAHTHHPLLIKTRLVEYLWSIFHRVYMAPNDDNKAVVNLLKFFDTIASAYGP